MGLIFKTFLIFGTVLCVTVLYIVGFRRVIYFQIVLFCILFIIFKKLFAFGKILFFQRPVFGSFCSD